MTGQIQLNGSTEAPSSQTIGQRLLFLLEWPWELIPLLGGLVWLYIQTMPPGISSWAIEQGSPAVLQITGSIWGVPPSPGYPLYTILSNLFVDFIGFLPGLSDSSTVWRVTFWSTVTSLLTIWFTYFTIYRLARNRAATLIATTALGLSFVFWRTTILATVYSFNALIFAMAYWFAIVWDRDPRRRWLVVLGLLIGAGIAHHRSAIILLPTLLLWVSAKRRKHFGAPPHLKGKPLWRIILHHWVILGLAALAPLLTYLYLPPAAARAGRPVMSPRDDAPVEGHPPASLRATRGGAM
ncbi:MAG: DUF2723 domain-containing protein, partial [Chloroflexota bacterium]